MTLQQLKYFISVAEFGNITYAAQRLYTSQPTVSRQIQMLENELGYQLFNRNSKPLKLTEHGKILYNGMKEALAQIDLTLETAKIAAEGKSGTLSIAFQTGYYSEYMFFEVINTLKESWPSLELKYNKMTTTQQHRGLENGSVDIAIGLDLPHWEEAGFKVKKLKKEQTLIVVSKDHRLAKKDHLEYKDLCGETFYLTSPNGYKVENIFKDVFCLTDVHQVEVESSEIAYFKVMSENGVTISNPHDPYLLGNTYYHSIPFESEYSDSYVCVTNPNNINPVVNLFMDLIKDNGGKTNQ